MNGRDIRICTIFAFAKMEFMEKLHPIMFAGTGSDVGKSIVPRLCKQKPPECLATRT